MLLSRPLAALAALSVGSVLAAPVPTLDTREYPSLSYYGYVEPSRDSPHRLPVVNKAAQPLGSTGEAENEGAVHAKRARAALMRAEGLSHKTWEVSTFFQAKAELYGVTEHNWSAKAFQAQQPGDAAVREATDKLGALLDVADDGYLVASDRGSQADVFSLVPVVWASGDRAAAQGMLGWLRAHGRRVGHAGDAYSHRGDRESLWSDEGYMIPPVLAFAGLVQGDAALLDEALAQWNLVAGALADEHGTFKHVPGEFDPHAWTSGTGWMLMGLARVAASVTEAGQAGALAAPLAQAKAAARRALIAAFGAQTPDGRLPNYTDRDSPPETAGTAAVVAAYYRLLAQDGDEGGGAGGAFSDPWLFAAAERAYAGVMAHVADDGTVRGCVDPSGADFDNADTDDSPEGHAFVPLMWAARNMWLGHNPDGKLPAPATANQTAPAPESWPV